MNVESTPVTIFSVARVLDQDAALIMYTNNGDTEGRAIKVTMHDLEAILRMGMTVLAEFKKEKKA